MRVTRADGYVTVEQLAELCDVRPPTVRKWMTRGYLTRDGRRVRLPFKRESRRILIDPVEGAKAEYATRENSGRRGYSAVAA